MAVSTGCLRLRSGTTRNGKTRAAGSYGGKESKTPNGFSLFGTTASVEGSHDRIGRRQKRSRPTGAAFNFLFLRYYYR
jgi:hypothetical protein